MDPHIVKAGLEVILAGNNAGAKVSAVKLLADLELYRQGDRDSRENELKLQIKTAAEEFDRKFAYRLERMDAIRRKQHLEILEPIGLGELVDLDDGQLVRQLARRLAAIPAAVREEHVAP
jgi:hypothetical protein